ncbi:MAG: hypothetical protein NT009_14415 [Proteobacteria bacterium]|nr:hypothetical protein [Pseudomonadota bacterium]
MNTEEKIQAIGSNLSQMEKNCRPEELWLVELIREKLAEANQQVLDYFLEITNQEKAKFTDWFLSPEESDDKLLEITKLAAALRECGVNLKKLSLSDNGRAYRVSELLERPETLEGRLQDKLHSLLSGENKKIEITGQVKMLECLVGCGNEEERPNPAPEAAACPPTPEEDSETEPHLNEFWNKKIQPDYLRIEVYNPASFLDKVPRILSRELLDSFIFSPQEKQTIEQVDGKKNIQKIVDSSPTKYDAINFFIYLKRKRVLEW